MPEPPVDLARFPAAGKWRPILHDAKASLHARMARSFFREVMLPVCEAAAAKVTEADPAGDDSREARVAQMVTHQSFALTLGALWEREFQDYLLATGAIIRPDKCAALRKRIERGSFDGLAKAFRAIRGFPLETFPMYGRLKQLHLVTSAVRHGLGGSSRALLEEEPGLFAPALVTDWFDYFTESVDPASVARLDITVDRLADYAEAVASFWDAITALRDATTRRE